MTKIATAVASICFLATAPLAVAVPSFPGAEGFGAGATGGRGGSVYHVTNLNDSGTGSFRDAVSQSNRIVVFDVGGVININSQVAFANNITVAGQTAPGGIALYGDGVSLSNRSNIVIRYMTFRQGIDCDAGDKALNMTNAATITIDHTSVGWGRWDNVGITSNSHDMTIQNSLVHEAINDQRFAMIIDSSRNLTLARNLFSNNQGRNPKGKGDLQFINNVIYNWRNYGYAGGHSSADWYQDLISNYFIAGKSSNNSYMSDFAATDKVYNSGNYVDLDKVDTGNDHLPEGSLISNASFTAAGATAMTAAHNNPSIPVTVVSALDAYRAMIGDAGNSLHRDSVDQRQIQHLLSLGTEGYIPADETQVGGMPTWTGGVAPTDTDRDGMPDAWELAHGLNPNLPSDGSQYSGNTGYTNVEVYLNSITVIPEPAGALGGGAAIGICLLRRRRVA